MGKFACFFGSILTAFGCLGTWFGFTTSGVAAGSWAAFYQSLIGNVASGSLFALFTSWGMKGIFLYSSGFGIIIFSSGLLSSYFMHKKEEKKNNFSERLSSFYNDSKENCFNYFKTTKEWSSPYISSAKEKANGFFNSFFKK